MSDSPGYLTPDKITNATFETKRKGFDPDAVKALLAKAGATVDALYSDRDELAAEIQSLQTALAEAQAAEPTTAEPQPLTDDELTERLGQDAVRVLSEARSAAADRIAEAKEEAEAIRASAEEAFARRSADADVEAQRIRANADAAVVKRHKEAEESAAAILASAEAKAEASRNELSSEVENADAEAARIVREAELTRRQILEDLARRRSAARRQIEQLRAGRERLLASHETVRRALDEISEELKISMSEARAAAETAGHSVSETTIEELEAEIETARLTGLLDTGPVPVVENVKPAALADTGPIPVVKASTPATSEGSTTDAKDDAVDDSAGGDTAVDDTESVADTAVDDTESVGVPVEDASVDDGGSADGDAKPDLALADAASSESSSNDDAVEPDTSEKTEKADDSSKSDTSVGNDDSADNDSADNESADNDRAGDLAPVVQLNDARSEVDTASHPAKGREASARTVPSSVQSSPALPSKKAVEAKEKARQQAGNVTKLESVKTSSSKNSDSKKSGSKAKADIAAVDGDGSDGGDVDDLFASLRSATEKPAAKKKSSASKKTTAKKASTKKAQKATNTTKAQSAPKAEPEPAVDSSEMARRFKRVLADEQSKAMSTVKGAEEVPNLEALLGSTEEHLATYWAEILGQVDDPADVTDPTRTAITDLVTMIRRRVGDGLESAGADQESAVASLRNIYREVKTQNIGETADAVCRTLPSPPRG